jgi:hypothetical protein
LVNRRHRVKIGAGFIQQAGAFRIRGGVSRFCLAAREEMRGQHPAGRPSLRISGAIARINRRQRRDEYLPQGVPASAFAPHCHNLAHQTMEADGRYGWIAFIDSVS